MATLLAGALVGCGEKTFDPPDREARVADADARFQEVRFDTLTWSSDEERAFLGNAIYASRCRDCHGTLGRGSTPYAQSRRLDVPSLVEPEWRMAESADSVRHRVFVGHASGMPTWGVGGLNHREIDAVAFYILERLRPEVVGDGAG
ncbi:MAG: c-type cytochrome [Longimicrobiales bacterium]|nr:c-type cytochrome [Longimicrobiales bacterium]